MCLIAYRREEEETFHKEFFIASAARNDHGTGIMYVKDGRVVTKKIGQKATQQDKLDMYYEWSIAPTPAFIHLRMCTSGSKEDENAHPFQVLSLEKDGVDLWMMHNGVFNVTELDANRSDTWHFVNLYLKPLLKGNPYILCNPYVRAMIEKYTGGSRLCFLYGDGTVVTIEDAQTHDDEKYGGCWLSNRSMIGTPPYQWAKDNYSVDKDTDYYSGSPYSRRMAEINRTDKVINTFKEGAKAVAEEEKKNNSQAVIELGRAGDKDTDNPAMDEDGDFDLAETLDEQIEQLLDMDDIRIIQLVDESPAIASQLLSNLRDYYKTQLTDLTGKRVA